MNAGNNLPQPLKSQISMQRGQGQNTNAGTGIPMVEQHQPHCCLNPQSNYGFYLAQGQGPPQNGALTQQQNATQANPNICGYCHCQCHFQHPSVSPAYPICYQQTSPQGTSRSFVSTSPSPYHMAVAASNPGMPFNPLMQTPGCVPTFTTSYTYPAAAGTNQQPHTSAYHMYVSTTAINADDPGLKAIKSIHEETSDSQGVTSDSSSERLTTRPGWKWDSVPASTEKQRSQGKIPRDEYKNQNVKKTESVSSKKYVGGNNADSLAKKGTGSSNKKIEVAKDNISSAKVSNSYARDGNSYIREGDSYARPTTYTVREDQASTRSSGRRVSISSNPPTKEPIYSAPLNGKDETTDRTENIRPSVGTSAKSGSARRSSVQKIKSAVRRSKSSVNKSSGSIGKQIERVEDKDIAKIEESYVVDVEEVPANAFVPLEEIEEVGNEYLAEDFGIGTSSNNEDYYEDPAMPEKREIQEDIDLMNDIGDQTVGITEANILPEKGRDNESENKNQPKLSGNYAEREANRPTNERGSYEMPKANSNKGPTVSRKSIQPNRVVSEVERAAATQISGIPLLTRTIPVESPKTEAAYKPKPEIDQANRLPEKGRDNDSENTSQPKSLGNHSRRNANSDRGSYEMSKTNLNKLDPGIIEVNGLPEKGRDNDSEKKSLPTSLGTYAGRDANKLNNERGSYEIPEINLNKVPGIIEVNGIPEKVRDTGSEKKSQPKSFRTNSGKEAARLSGERGRASYEMPKTNSNKRPTVSRKSIQPNRVVSEVERAAATQTSGIPLPTMIIPEESPKTEAAYKPNVTRRSVDQQSQTGKFPRKKTLEMLSQLSLESFDKLISSFVGISLYDKDERVANLINAILESAEPEMEGSSTLRNTLYIHPEVFRDDDNITGGVGSSKYRFSGSNQQRKTDGTTSLQKQGYLTPPKINSGPISANARKASVNNIIQEFSNNKKFDDTLSNIKETFPGEKIDNFVETLSKQAEKMTDDKEIENAGRLVRLLIGNRDISKKEAIHVISSALVDLPQNLVDSPMAATSTAQYLVEIFSEESNFDWLFQIGMKLIQTDDARTNAAWRDLSINTLKMLKSKNNER